MNAVSNLLFFAFLCLFSYGSFAATIIEDTKLDSKNMITLYGKIDDAQLFSVASGLHFLNHEEGMENEPIYLLIDSEGGDLFAGGKIIDYMKASHRPVYTVCVGAAMSMASAIHQYGVKRYIVPSGILMYHDAAGIYAGDVEHVRHRLDLTDKKVKEYNKNTSNRTGISMSEIETRERGEWWMTAEEALRNHFVDDIVMSTGFFPKKPKVKEPLVPTPELPGSKDPEGE